MRFVSLVKDGAFYVLGADDGSIRIHNANDFQRSYSLPVHDNNYGHVTRVVASFDNSHLLSVGDDGNFFVFATAFTGEPDKVRQTACPHPPSFHCSCSPAHWHLPPRSAPRRTLSTQRPTASRKPSRRWRWTRR